MTFWDKLEEVLIAIVYGEKPPTDMPTPTPSPNTAESQLDVFCDGITYREGANPANNNPGNCKFYYGGYLPIYGHVTRSEGGFAQFPTLAQGRLYLENTVRDIVKHHPTLTIYQFFAGGGGFTGYAPKNDGNDPTGYSQQVATRLGVDNSFAMSKIVV